MRLSMNMNKTGIKAQQLALDAISNNIANTTTEGYKAKGVRFQTLLNNEVTEEDVLLNDVNPQISAGARSEVAVTNFNTGTFRDGTSALNLAIAGEGFFGVENNTGDLYLTKDGSFTVDGTGRLVNGNGDFLVMDGTLPPLTGGNENLFVGNDGTLFIQENGESVAVGRLNIYMPVNLEQLQPAGENYFIDPTNNLMLLDNTNIQSNRIEMSNVDLAEELTNMMVAQRAYSLNVKVAQSTDEMMSLINQLNI